MCSHIPARSVWMHYNHFQFRSHLKCHVCFPVSPEVLGFLTAIGLFIILMTLLFWYLNNKLALENPGNLQCLDDFRKTSELQGERAEPVPLIPGGSHHWDKTPPIFIIFYTYKNVIEGHERFCVHSLMKLRSFPLTAAWGATSAAGFGLSQPRRALLLLTAVGLLTCHLPTGLV